MEGDRSSLSRLKEMDEESLLDISYLPYRNRTQIIALIDIILTTIPSVTIGTVIFLVTCGLLETDLDTKYQSDDFTGVNENHLILVTLATSLLVFGAAPISLLRSTFVNCSTSRAVKHVLFYRVFSFIYIFGAIAKLATACMEHNWTTASVAGFATLIRTLFLYIASKYSNELVNLDMDYQMAL